MSTCTFNRDRVNPEFIGLRSSQLRTDGGHRREFAGTGPVVLKLISSNGCCLVSSGNSMDRFVCSFVFAFPFIITARLGMCYIIRKTASEEHVLLARTYIKIGINSSSIDFSVSVKSA